MKTVATFEAKERFVGSIDVEVDPDDKKFMQEDQITLEIENAYPDLEEIEIISIEETK